MTPASYFLDYETFSPEDIKKTGAFKYAAHPEAEILIAAIARGDEPPVAWSVLDPFNVDFLMLLDEAVSTGAVIWSHNAQFEYAVTKHLFRRTFHMEPPALEQWHCTAALCRLAAIPSSLEDAGAFLSIDMPKDAEGARLIGKFSSPRKPSRKDPRARIYPADEPEEFQKFVDYCLRDVEAERAIYRKIKLIDQKTPGQVSYRADMRMNDHGIPVNIEALRKAKALIDEYNERLIPRFRAQVASPQRITLPLTTTRKETKEVDISEGFNPSQREAMVQWLQQRGFTGGDLQQDTVDRWLVTPLADHLTPEARAALHTYSLVGSAAVKKIPAMLERAMRDGFIRGALMIYGAERTHRWTGKGIQPQNFARPTILFTELAYHAICEGWGIDDIEANFGDLYEVLASCIRHFIQPHGGEMVLQADYSAIEARIAPWLCNEEATLELFRRGEPLYELMAGLIFHKAAEDVTKAERFIGKQSVLGCSYNMGRPKFRATCESYGFSPPLEMVESYKPRHDAFIRKAFKKAEREIEMKFEKKGVPIPAKYQTEEFMTRKVCVDNNWFTLTPETDAEWANFAFDDLADRAVSTWRENNPKIVKMWRQLDDAAKQAIREPGTRAKAGRIEFMMMGEDVLGFPALGMRLPSGHHLIYPQASVEKNESRGWGTQIRFWGVIPNSGGQWGWCYTYGGKLLENATQATAGDVMREGMLAAEAEGYQPFMLVHDEMLAIQRAGQTHERLCELLCTMPAWADGLPLAAEGSTIPFYKK